VGSNFIVEQQDGITTIRLTRRLSVDEFFQMLEDIAGRELSDRRLWDGTRNFNFSAEEIRRIASSVSSIFPPAARVAFVAADDLTFGQVRMFEAFKDQDDYQTKVFRDEQTAREWLLADSD